MPLKFSTVTALHLAGWPGLVLSKLLFLSFLLCVQFLCVCVCVCVCVRACVRVYEGDQRETRDSTRVLFEGEKKVGEKKAGTERERRTKQQP